MISDDNIHWIVDGLKDYGRFGEMLVPHKDGLDFSRAEIFPEEVSSLNFRWGIPPDFKTKPGGGYLRFVGTLRKDILEKDDVVCLFHECDFRRGDPCMEDDPLDKIYVDDDIFYRIDSQTSEEMILETVHDSSKFMLMFEYSGCARQLSGRESLTYDEVAAMTAHMISVTFGICDDEAYCRVPFSYAYRDGREMAR